MAPRRLGACLALALALLACAAPPPTEPKPPAAESLREDAGPRIFAEDEVDVPAHPVRPILPAYPASLRALGVEGTVEAEVIVWADGSVRGGELVSSTHDAFARAVRRALREAAFVPAVRDGKKVPSRVRLTLDFRLER